MKRLFTSIDDFSKTFKGIGDKPERLEALKRYFARGGVISVEGSPKGWPKLVYPDVQRLRQQIKELRERKSIYEKQHSDWKKKHDSAKLYDIKNSVLKFSDPLYWKHKAKYHTDKEYKKDADSVKLPVHLVSDNRWKPMIKMFVEDGEYRANLVETVTHSIVYNKDKKLAKYADTLKEFRIDVSSKAITSIEKKVESIDKDISAMEEIAKWAGER